MAEREQKSVQAGAKFQGDLNQDGSEPSNRPFKRDDGKTYIWDGPILYQVRPADQLFREPTEEEECLKGIGRHHLLQNGETEIVNS